MMTLRSTLRGYLHTVFNAALWSCLLLVAISVGFKTINSIYASHGVASWSDFKSLPYAMTTTDEEFFLVLLHIGIWSTYLIIAIIACIVLEILLYKVHTIGSLFKDGGDHWGRAITTTYRFPFGRKTVQTLFDRVIKIEIEQTTLDVPLNTGTLRIETVTFTNAGSETRVLEIPAIISPFERKAEIEAALLPHQGLTVRMENNG